MDGQQGTDRRIGRRSSAAGTGLILGAVLPSYLVASSAVAIREDFNFTDAELGLATGLSFMAAALSAPSAGRIVERLGTERGIYFSSALVVLSSLAIAVVANSAAALIFLMATTGLGGGIGAPSVSSMLARNVPVARQGMAFGMITAAPQLAAFLAGLALPMVAEPFDWRAAFVGAAVINGLCAASIPRRDHRPSPTRAPAGDARPASRLSVWLVAVAAALASASGFGLRFFVVVFAAAAGFSSSQAGILLAATGFIAIFSRLGFGFLGDRRPGDALLRASRLMLVCAAGFVLLLVPSQPLIVAGVLLAGGLGWGWHAPLSLAVVERNRDAAAQAMGFQLAGYFSGGVMGPLLVGVLAQHGTYTVAWLLCCGLATAGAATTLVARRIDPGR